MAIRDENGILGDKLSSKETMEKLSIMFQDTQLPRAVYFGTEQEIDDVIAHDDLKERVTVLETRVEIESYLASFLHVHIPTKKEMNRILKKK